MLNVMRVNSRSISFTIYLVILLFNTRHFNTIIYIYIDILKYFTEIILRYYIFYRDILI